MQISNTKQKSELCKVINISDILENMEQSGDTSEVSTALKSIDLNSKENTENTGCFLCQKPDPVKKCSKSHSRCKGNFFCDKNCELSFHKSEKTKVLHQKFCFYLLTNKKQTKISETYFREGFLDFKKFCCPILFLYGHYRKLKKS